MKQALARWAMAAATVAVGFGAVPATASSPRHPRPETVVISYRAKPGRQGDLLAVLRRQWRVLTRLKLVQPSGHQLFQGRDEFGGDTVFVELFTWKDAGTPDHPPAAVSAVWNQMRPLLAPGGADQGIRITTVRPVPLRPARR